VSNVGPIGRPVFEPPPDAGALGPSPAAPDLPGAATPGETRAFSIGGPAYAGALAASAETGAPPQLTGLAVPVPAAPAGGGPAQAPPNVRFVPGTVVAGSASASGAALSPRAGAPAPPGAPAAPGTGGISPTPQATALPKGPVALHGPSIHAQALQSRAQALAVRPTDAPAAAIPPANVQATAFVQPTLTPQALRPPDPTRGAADARGIDRRDPSRLADAAALGLLKAPDGVRAEQALPPPESFPLKDVFARLPQRRAQEIVLARGPVIAAEILAHHAARGPAELGEAVRIFEKLPPEVRSQLAVEIADIGFPALLRGALASVDRATQEAAVRRFAEFGDPRRLLDGRAPFRDLGLAIGVVRALPPNAALELVRQALRAGLPPSDVRVLLLSLDIGSREVLLREMLASRDEGLKALARALATRQAGEDVAAGRALLTRLGLLGGSASGVRARGDDEITDVPRPTKLGVLSKAAQDGGDQAVSKAVRAIQDPGGLEDLAAAALEENLADLRTLGLAEALRTHARGVRALGLVALEELFAKDAPRAKRLVSDVFEEILPQAAGHVAIAYEDRGRDPEGGLGRQSDLLDLLRTRSLAGLKAIALERAALKVGEARIRVEAGDDELQPALERAQLTLACLYASDPAGIAAFGRDHPELFPTDAMGVVLQELVRSRPPAVRAAIAEAVARLLGPALGATGRAGAPATPGAPAEGAFGLGYLLGAGLSALRAIARHGGETGPAESKLGAERLGVACRAGFGARGDPGAVAAVLPALEGQAARGEAPPVSMGQLVAEAEGLFGRSPHAPFAMKALRAGFQLFAG